jgi:hypothetical protein
VEQDGVLRAALKLMLTGVRMFVGVSPDRPSIKDSKLSEVKTLVGVSMAIPSMLLTQLDLTPRFRLTGLLAFPTVLVVAVVVL